MNSITRARANQRAAQRRIRERLAVATVEHSVLTSEVSL